MKPEEDPLLKPGETVEVTDEDRERYRIARQALNHGGGNLVPAPDSREEKLELLLIRDEQDRKAVELRSKRKSYPEIARILGLDHAASARRAVQRGLAQSMEQQSILEQRELILYHYDQMTQVVWEVLEANHLVVSNGRVVKLNGKPLKDQRPVLEAVDRLLAIERDRAMITGVRVPKQQQVMITHDNVNAAIRALEDAMGISPEPIGGSGHHGWEPGRATPIEARVLEEPPPAQGSDGAGSPPGVPD